MSPSLDGLRPGPELSGMLRPVQTPNTVDADVFPPLRAQTTEQSIFLPYVTEDIAFEEEYEEYLRWSEHSDAAAGGPGAGAPPAWARLPELVHDIADGISDSESIVSIGELNDDTRLDAGGKDARDMPDENVNNWEVRPPCFRPCRFPRVSLFRRRPCFQPCFPFARRARGLVLMRVSFSAST